jgi:hypothetical protein
MNWKKKLDTMPRRESVELVKRNQTLTVGGQVDPTINHPEKWSTTNAESPVMGHLNVLSTCEKRS